MSVIPETTPLTDRQLLVHLLEHVEQIDTKVTDIHVTLQEHRPLLERLRRTRGRIWP